MILWQTENAQEYRLIAKARKLGREMQGSPQQYRVSATVFRSRQVSTTSIASGRTLGLLCLERFSPTCHHIAWVSWSRWSWLEHDVGSRVGEACFFMQDIPRPLITLHEHTVTSAESRTRDLRPPGVCWRTLVIAAQSLHSSHTSQQVLVTPNSLDSLTEWCK